MSVVALKRLRPGQKGRIVRISVERADRRRIMAMGVIKGEQVEVERKAPLGDPIEVKIKGYHLSIRGEDAENILVDPE